MTGDALMVLLYGLTALFLMVVITICLFVPELGRFLVMTAARIYRVYADYSPITYLSDDGLTPVSRRCLELVAKKTLVLDMDETLMSAWVQRQGSRQSPFPNVPYDFKFILLDHRSKGNAIYVYKRPYVDYFLDSVSRWYDLVVFTCGTQEYATPILDFLDGGRGILTKRFFRQHTIGVSGLRAKYISVYSDDLANILLLDNSKLNCSFNVGNSLPIASYKIGQRDDALITLLPFLDALRFTKDVRSVLGKCTKFDCITTILESVSI